MLRIKALQSFDRAVADAAEELAALDARRADAFTPAVGAAYEQVCENPSIGRPLGGRVRGHPLIGFSFAVIYEVSDAEVCFLYLAPTSPDRK